MQNDWSHPRNILEQTSKETVEKCSQEVDQTESRVYRLLTRSEKKKKWKDSVSVLKKRSLIGGYKNMLLKNGIPEIL
jgi:hypothetical protein